MRTMYILWLRQIKRYSRSRSRIVGSLGQPLLFLVALGFGFGPVFEKAGGGNYVQFLAPGIIAMSILFTAMFSGVEIIWDRQFGFLKETLVAPVPRLHIMIGRTLGSATVAFLQGIVVFLIAMVVGFRPDQWALLPVTLLTMFLLALLFTAFGTALASLMEDFHGFQLIMNFLVMPLFFLSGALFPLEDLPPLLDVLTRIDPLTYGIDALRGSLIGMGHYPLVLDMGILTLLVVALMITGSWLFSRIEV
ncbi:MAG: ABC transporter permease [Candidatus Peribacteraceae bacterium]